MKAVFLTDGAGFPGINLILRLLIKNWHVVSMDLVSSIASLMSNGFGEK